MPQKVPAWLIGLAGASLILIATAINSLVAPNLDAKLTKLETRSTALDQEAKNLWMSHTRADDIEVTAMGQLTICSQMRGSPLAACHVTVSGMYRTVILNMLAASGRDVEDPKHEKRAKLLLEKIATSDVSSLAKVVSWINELRLESRDAINSRRENIEKLQNRITADKSSHERVTVIWSALLNVFGLLLVLLKDLPIWRRTGPEAHGKTEDRNP